MARSNALEKLKSKAPPGDAEEDGELPEGWTGPSVLALCDIVRGVSYSKGEALAEPKQGYVPLLRANNIDEELNFCDLQHVPPSRVSEEQHLQVGDVVVAMSSGSKKVVGKAASHKGTFNGTFGAFCGVLRPFPTLDSRFFGIYFQTQAYRHQISEASAGTNINNLKREYFAALTLPLPPLAEQKRIVAKVETLLARVNEARERLAKVPPILKRFRQSVLAAACSGRLTEDWRETNSKNEPVFDSNRTEAVDEVPDYWRWALVSDIAAVQGGIQKQPKRQPQKSRFPFLRVANVLRGRLDLAEVHEIELFNGELERLRLLKGDILVVEGNGSLTEIGRCAVWDGSIPDCVHQNHLIRVRPAKAIPAYLDCYWNSPAGIERITNLAATTSGLYTLSVRKVESIPVPIPPTEEQREIVRRVEKLFKLADAIEKRVAAATARADRLTQAILAKAFRGELVPTEAALARRENRPYEPASELLKRIQTAHAKNALAPKKRARAHG